MAFLFFDPNPQFSDANGVPLNSGTLTFYSAGTLVLKSTFNSSALSTANDNPITLNSAGRSPVEIWMDGSYRVILKDSAGNTIWDRDNITESEAAELSLLQFGADSTGTNSVVAAVNAISAAYPTAAVRIIVPRGTYLFSTNYTTASNITWVFRGGLFKPATSTTLTIGGSIDAHEADRIFTNAVAGQGTVAFTTTTKLKAVYAEWWGAAGDNSSDDSTFITAALLAATTAGGQLDVPLQGLARAYRCNVVIPPYYSGDTFVKGRIWRGIGLGTRYVSYSANGSPCISFDGRTGSKSVNGMIELASMFVGQGSTTNNTPSIRLIGAGADNFIVTGTTGSPVITLQAGADTSENTVGEMVVSTLLPAGTTILSVDSATQLTLSANLITGSSGTYDASRRMAMTSGDATITLTTGSTVGLSPGDIINGGNIPQNVTILSITDATHFEMTANATGTDTDLPLYVGAIEVTIGVNCRIYGEINDVYVANNQYNSGGGYCMHIERPLGFNIYNYQYEAGHYGLYMRDGSNVRVFGMHGRTSSCGGMIKLDTAAGSMFNGIRTEEGRFADDDTNLAVLHLTDTKDCTFDICQNEGSDSIRATIYMLGTNPGVPAESGVCTNNTFSNFNVAAPSREDIELNVIHLQGNVYDNQFEGRWGSLTSSFQLVGSITSGSDAVTTISDTSRIRIGAAVSGTGIPASTTVIDVVSATEIQLSANATSGTATPTTLSFSNSGDDILGQTSTLRITVNTASGSGTFIAGEAITGSVSVQADGVTPQRGIVESYDSGTGVIVLNYSTGDFQVAETITGVSSGASRPSTAITAGPNPHSNNFEFQIYANNAGSPVITFPQTAFDNPYVFRDQRSRVLTQRNGRSLSVNNQAVQSLEMTEGSYFNNDGATGAVTVSLPAGRQGLTARFAKTTNQTFRIDPNGTETIRGGAAGKYLQLTNLGDSVTLAWDVDTGVWEIVTQSGGVSDYSDAAFDPGSLADGAGETKTVAATGVALGDLIESTSFSLDLQGITWTAYVSSANVISVRLQNETGAGPIDLASGTARFRVRKAGSPYTFEA